MKCVKQLIVYQQDLEFNSHYVNSQSVL